VPHFENRVRQAPQLDLHHHVHHLDVEGQWPRYFVRHVHLLLDFHELLPRKVLVDSLFHGIASLVSFGSPLNEDCFNGPCFGQAGIIGRVRSLFVHVHHHSTVLA